MRQRATHTHYALLGVVLVGLTTVARPLAAVADAASAYLDQVEQRIMAKRKLPPKSDGLKVVLRYHLAPTGVVLSVRVEKTSGNQRFDDSAGEAVRRANPFPPPPNSFPIGDLRLVLEPTLSHRT